jgi:hypothetical protein
VRSRGRATAVALAAAAVAAAGCGSGGGSTDSAQRATLQRYFAALAAKHPDAACAELTERSRERLAEFAKPLKAGGNGCPATMNAVLASRYGQQLARLGHPVIDQVKTSGDHATADVDGVDKPLALSREGGTWRIEFTPSVEADKLPGGPKESGDQKDAG